MSLIAIALGAHRSSPQTELIDLRQILDGKEADLAFFLHGSMGCEIVPEVVLRAFARAYPDVYSTAELSQFDPIAAKRGATHVDAHRAKMPLRRRDRRAPVCDRRSRHRSVARATFHRQAGGCLNNFLAKFETLGYEAPNEFGVRSTGQYFAASLNGVWARTPFLHNGSVRTLEEVAARA